MPVFGVPVLEDLPPVEGRSVLVRVDFNVPMQGGEITDDLRVRAARPTLEWLKAQGASRIVACSHLGRPKGAPDPRYTMDAVRACLTELCPGVELAENLRFDPGEEADDPAFVARLVEGFDCYVNDAFGASHRAHASIVGPPRTLPSAAGRLLAEEVEVLLRLRNDPPRPFVAILGGSKVSDKLGVINALLDVCDTLLIGGAMCFTFLRSQGRNVGDSLLEADQVETCRELLARADGRIVLPEDITALGEGGKLFDPRAGGQVVQAGVTLPRAGWAPTSGPAPPRRSATSSTRPAACCGTGRWARSRTPASRPGPATSPRRWPTAGASRWSAAATRPPRSRSSTSPTGSTTCRPAAGRPWS